MAKLHKSYAEAARMDRYVEDEKEIGETLASAGRELGQGVRGADGGGRRSAGASRAGSILGGR